MPVQRFRRALAADDLRRLDRLAEPLAGQKEGETADHRISTQIGIRKR